MNTVELYELAEANNIFIHYRKINRLAFALKYGENYHVAISPKALSTEQLEREVLAEEISHCITDSFYPFAYVADKMKAQRIAKAETKAREYSLTLLVPLAELKDALTEETDIYQLAEVFDTTPQMIIKALAYYKRKELL